MQDFEKGEVKQFKKAWLYYENLAQRMAGSGHCLDVFACSLDQVGIAEMHEAIAKTGSKHPSATTATRQPQQCCLCNFFTADLVCLLHHMEAKTTDASGLI